METCSEVADPLILGVVGQKSFGTQQFLLMFKLEDLAFKSEMKTHMFTFCYQLIVLP